MVAEPLIYEPLQLIEDPYPLYARLRDEEPLYRSGRGAFWVLSRYCDVQDAARDCHLFSSAEGNDLDDTALLFAPAGELTHADPPVHSRLRDNIRREFGPSAVRSSLEPVVRTKVRGLLSTLVGRRHVDFAEELARPLPGTLICGWLGFAEADHAQLMLWFETMLERTPLEVSLPHTALEARDAMRAHIRSEMQARRGRPRDDLLSVLVAARASGGLSTDEAIGTAMLLFFAGIVTTSALLSGALVSLAQFPDQRRLLLRSPDLIGAAIEEFLRFDAPLQWLTRVATQAVEMHGASIAPGDRVVLLWGSANRDERRWEHADQLILTREPKRHLAFGEGIHHCLGAVLARLEARVVLEELLPLVGDYTLAGPVERQYTQAERTIVHLPVQIQWSSPAGRRRRD